MGHRGVRDARGLLGRRRPLAAPPAPGRRSGRASGRPWGLVPIAVAALGAWAIAEAWEEHSGRSIPWMATGFALIHLLVGPALRAVEGPAEIGLRILAAGATVSVALLALWRTGTLSWVIG